MTQSLEMRYFPEKVISELRTEGYVGIEAEDQK